MGVESIGRYELRSVVARTPSSTVYEGWDARIARKVAIKIVPVADKSDPETQELLLRFNRGAQAAGMLSHPSIVGLYDYGETDDSAYLVMEFIEGVTLKALLEQTRRLPVKTILSVVDDVMAGLAYSHAHGVIHRDIKPANLMVLADGRVKITDFGVARIDSSSVTQAGTMIGTPAYMSPEQFRGDPVDHRIDIYAMGIVLYQMLTGQRPYEGSVGTIAHKVLHTEPRVPSQVAAGLSDAFDPVVQRAIAKRPEDRYASAVDFARAVHAAAAATAPDITLMDARAPLHANEARDRSAGRRPRRGAARVPVVAWPVVAWPVVAGAVVGVAIGAVLLWPARTATPPPAQQAFAALPPPPAAAQPAPPSSAPPSSAPPSSAHAAVPDITGMSGGPRLPDAPGTDAPNTDAPNTDVHAAPGIAASELPLLREAVVTLPPLPRPAAPIRPRPLPPPPLPPALAQQTPMPPAPVPPAPVSPVAVQPVLATLPPVASERPRVRLYYQRESAPALQLTTDIAQRLLFSDFAYADTRSATNAPHGAEVRFFHPDDAAAATRLAALLGGLGPAFQVRDLSDRAPPQSRGGLEVWIGR